MKTVFIQRIFHPVGQGAFYSERHLVDGQPFNIVYDCGNRGCMSKVRPVVEEAFGMDEFIDILFISHFDSDHVSLISDLKPYKSGHIRKVVLPLLHPKLRYALVGYYLSTADRRTKYDPSRQVELILEPHKFFVNAEVLHVLPDEQFAAAFHSDDGFDFGALNEFTNVMQSGKSVVADVEYWTLIPFNCDIKRRFQTLMEDLEDWFDRSGATWNDLGRIEFVNANRSELKSIYRRRMKINENSMLLYSGPKENGLDHLRVDIRYSDNSEINCARMGCIYTGDSNLNLFDLKSVYRAYMPHVGTIQIPHHGSQISFCQKNFPANAHLCPVSYGTRNTYKHPWRGLKKLITNAGGTFVPITEKKQSVLVETISGSCIILNHSNVER